MGPIRTNSMRASAPRRISSSTSHAAAQQNLTAGSREQQHAQHTSLTPTLERNHPLHTHPNDVGPEVESFAQLLDKWEDRKQDEDIHKSLLGLVTQYKGIAQDAIRRLGVKHGRRPRQTDDTNTLELQRWQAEVDTWELLRIMLELEVEGASEQLKQGSETDEENFWQAFTAGDKGARERMAILKWLETTAPSTSENVFEKLEAIKDGVADKGAVWGKGWFHTKEQVKGRKRMRPWNPDSSSELPAAKRTKGDASLVTQLDPDAVSRQYASVEVADESMDSAMWQGCWEMFRRGVSGRTICEWFEDHDEQWRAVSAGRAWDADVKSAAAPGAKGGALWRRMCFSTARYGTTVPYEAAVYGLLAGDIPSVERVCSTWGDFMYAHYNAMLLSQYDHFLQAKYPHLLSPAQARRFPMFDAVQFYGQESNPLAKLADRLCKMQATAEEARQPTRLMQAALLSKDMDTFFQVQGKAIAQSWSQLPEGKPFFPQDAVTPVGDDSITSLGDDKHSLRMLTHITLIFDHLKTAAGTNKMELQAQESIITAYIDYLRLSGSFFTIPTYARRLPKDKVEYILARVLPDITEPQSQLAMLRLMDGMGPDVVEVDNVFFEHVLYTLDKSGLLMEPEKALKLKLMEPTSAPNCPGYRIRVEALSGDVTKEEKQVIRSLGWYRHVDGYWTQMFEGFNLVLSRLIIHGRYAAAFALVKEYPFAVIASEKASRILGEDVDIMSLKKRSREQPAIRRTTRSTSVQLQQETEMADELDDELLWRLIVMKDEAVRYYRFEQIVNSLTAIADWTEQEENYLSNSAEDMSQLSNPASKKYLTEFIDAVIESVEALLRENLTEAKDEAEGNLRHRIRNTYIPSIAFAYIVALHSAGHILSRDYLLTCMDLSATIAGNKELISAFTEENQMELLLKFFASSSQALLRLNQDRPVRKKMKSNGQTLNIWAIKSPEA